MTARQNRAATHLPSIRTLDLRAPQSSYQLSVYSDDTGMVIVSDTEVGLFRNFADY